MNLTSPSVVKDLLTRHGLSADKRFGQNFLVDSHALEKIVAAAELSSGQIVWEVGPGLGTLTRALALTGASVNTVEMDKRLTEVHSETLAGLDVNIHWGDALKFDWSTVQEQSVFVGNLPYNIATPLITKLLVSRRFARIVVLVQKEVAQRMVASANTEAYGILSTRIEYHSEAKKLFDVPPGSFLPAPKVTSSVVRMLPNQDQDDPKLFQLIEAAFAQRRKTLHNSLKSKGFDSEKIQAALQQMELRPDIRGEALSLENFKVLYSLLT